MKNKGIIIKDDAEKLLRDAGYNKLAFEEYQFYKTIKPATRFHAIIFKGKINLHIDYFDAKDGFPKSSNDNLLVEKEYKRIISLS